MAKAQVLWTVTPTSAFGNKFKNIASEAKPGLEALAKSHAARGESDMKHGAPWTDRTTHARNSLYGRAEGTDIELGTTNEEYGLFLELGTSKMAPRAIIVPTANALAPQYFEDAAAFLDHLLGA